MNSNKEVLKFEQPTILIVEDDQMLREILSLFLKDYYSIAIAANGKEAIQILQQQKIHLVLTDFNMPIMDGAQLCLQMTECFPEIPFIIMSANKRGRIFAKTITAPFIEKPFYPEAIIQLIRRLLAESQSKHLRIPIAQVQ
jgi:CheY-like chemotaxis protein